jgi:hypothetical protein
MVHYQYAGTGADEPFNIFVVVAVNVAENGAMLGDYMSRVCFYYYCNGEH